MVVKKENDDKKKISELLDDLASLENYTKELFSFSPLPTCFISPIGVILGANPAFEEISGYNIYELIGKPIEELFSKEQSEKILKGTKKDESREMILFNKKREKIPVSVLARLRKTKEGEVTGSFVGFFDLTKIKKSERQLQEKIEELEKFNKFAVGRELKMTELKEEIKRLKKELKGRKIV